MAKFSFGSPRLLLLPAVKSVSLLVSLVVFHLSHQRKIMTQSKKRSISSSSASSATPDENNKKRNVKVQRQLTSFFAAAPTTTTGNSSSSPATAPKPPLVVPVSSRSNDDDEEEKDDSSSSSFRDDDDEDDFELLETTNKAAAVTAKTSTRSGGRRTTTRNNTAAATTTTTKTTGPPPKPTRSTKKRATPDTTTDQDEEVEESKEASQKKKQKSTKQDPSSEAAAATNKKKKNDSTSEFTTKLQKDRANYKPNNNPQKWPGAHHEYVDPVGLDPTHGIVESILSTQVSKIAKLLIYNSTYNAINPIRLQTACSGTDAPSIALGMVQEILHRNNNNGTTSNKNATTTTNNKNNNNPDGHDQQQQEQQPQPSGGFHYSHEMSCEMEPFKQAYIARNFPGVTLFPDICKLTATDDDIDNNAASSSVLDVYGRPQSIPTGNLFVAGTSCKDFSMLKATYRLDIEDKGTSGETFLAAVDFLQRQQPSMAIFENVDGAPWEKMQEYITGYCKLAQRNDTKAIVIGSSKKSNNADTELKFSVQNDTYVAEAVPRQVGIQAGATVQGFIRGIDTTHPIITIQPNQKDDQKEANGTLLTLGQLAKRHGIDLARDTLVMHQNVRYCTHLCKLDSKEYGLPQTRNRKVRENAFCHLFCVHSTSIVCLFMFVSHLSSISFCGKPTIPMTMIWVCTFKKYSTISRRNYCIRWTPFCCPIRMIGSGASAKHSGRDPAYSSSANGPRNWTFGIGIWPTSRI
jgi:hypothetical protein